MLSSCRMFVLSIILIIDFASMIVTGESTAVVQTTTGPMQGLILKTQVKSVKYALFKGIRFGKAPVGRLRFKPPVPVDPWTEILNATSPGHECPQMDPVTSTIQGSEDCLFLSVWTTVTDFTTAPRKLKSVMVWIYGGGFFIGSHLDPRCQPDFLLEKDVIVVAINYRLGALGFLSLNHPEATGNAGMKDQVLALKWIKANIEQFGGNPNNITIFGQSAGGVSVGLHVLSEASAGLFHGAISMSGTPLVPWGFILPDDAVSRAQTLSLFVGEPSTDDDKVLQALYGVSIGELVHKSPYVSPVIPFAPTIEDASIATDVFLSECTVNKYNTGNFTKVPQIIGFMDQETVAFLSVVSRVPSLIDQALKIHSSTILRRIKTLLGPGGNLLARFGKNVFEAVVNETTNLLFRIQIDTTQRLLAAKNGDQPIYYYDVTFATNESFHNIEQNTSIVGPGHADDVPYIFLNPALTYNYSFDDPTGLTVHRITTMWTNFAKYGNPTPHWVSENPLGVTWPSSGCVGRALDIGFNLTVGRRPIDLRTDIIEAANNVILGGQNGCKTRTRLATCKRTISSLFSIGRPIF